MRIFVNLRLEEEEHRVKDFKDKFNILSNSLSCQELEEQIDSTLTSGC